MSGTPPAHCALQRECPGHQLRTAGGMSGTQPANCALRTGRIPTDRRIAYVILQRDNKVVNILRSLFDMSTAIGTLDSLAQVDCR